MLIMDSQIDKDTMFLFLHKYTNLCFTVCQQFVAGGKMLSARRKSSNVQTDKDNLVKIVWKDGIS